MPTNKDSEERRNEFVEAAERLFKENGIVDTTINSIVKEMDVAKGLFYYYFKSKDDVIDAISEKYNEVFMEMMNASMDKPDYKDRLEQYIENSVFSFRNLTKEVENAEVDLTALSRRSIDEALNTSIDGLENLLEEGNENGTYSFKYPKYYATIFISGILRLIEDNKATNKQIKEIILDLIVREGKEY